MRFFNFQTAFSCGVSTHQNWRLFLFNMAKDPAFLFYSSDFLIGTSLLTNEEVGKYIKILCWLHQHGPIKKENIETLVGKLPDNLMVKFSLTEDGFLFNERLSEEIEKRKNFIQSRIDNGKKGGRKPLGKPLGKAKKKLPENENEDENINTITENEILNSIEFVKITGQKNFSKSQVLEFWKAFLTISEKEFYKSRDEKIKHFRNWLKKQSNEQSISKNQSNGLGKKSGGFGILSEALRQATGGGNDNDQ